GRQYLYPAPTRQTYDIPLLADAPHVKATRRPSEATLKSLLRTETLLRIWRLWHRDFDEPIYSGPNRIDQVRLQRLPPHLQTRSVRARWMRRSLLVRPRTALLEWIVSELSTTMPGRHLRKRWLRRDVPG